MSDRAIQRVFCTRQQGAHVLATRYADRIAIAAAVITREGVATQRDTVDVASLEGMAASGVDVTCGCGIVYTLDLCALLSGSVQLWMNDTHIDATHGVPTHRRRGTVLR